MDSVVYVLEAGWAYEGRELLGVFDSIRAAGKHPIWKAAKINPAEGCFEIRTSRCDHDFVSLGKVELNAVPELY